MSGWARFAAANAVALVIALSWSHAAFALPTGYLVWSSGTADDPTSRKIHRLSLPGRTERLTLTSGEDIEPQISPDGKWVAYAKAKFADGSDYHNPKLWKIYLVSIHGAGERRGEIKIDDDGAWPSWSRSGALFYNQADGTHTHLVRVEIDERGRVVKRQTVVSSRTAFAGFAELNEIAVAPDESWFAARTRGNAVQNGVHAFTIAPPAQALLARAGEVGCMPRVAPSGLYGVIAGAGEGIRWGHAPAVVARKQDQLLIAARPGQLAYHPDVSSDGRWVLAAHGAGADHNAGRYDLAIYALDPETMITSGEEMLTSSGFNGWPHLWVGPPSTAPPPRPEVGEFLASSYTVAPGEMVTLSWQSFGGAEVLLDGAPVMATGTLERMAAATATHTLTVKAAGAVDMRSLTVTVNPTPVAVEIAELVAEPARVEKGRSTKLRWRVRNATTLDLDGQAVAPEGEREVGPLAATTYVLTARGHEGPKRAELTVAVDEPSSGLLPDRGGFRCAFGGAARGDRPAAPILLFALIAIAISCVPQRSRRLFRR